MIGIGAKILGHGGVGAVPRRAERLMYTLQGLDKPGRSMVISLGRQSVYVPLLYGLTALFGFTGFLFAYPSADLIISLVSAALTIKLLLGLANERREESAPAR